MTTENNITTASQSETVAIEHFIANHNHVVYIDWANKTDIPGPFWLHEVDESTDLIVLQNCYNCMERLKKVLGSDQITVNKKYYKTVNIKPPRVLLINK